VGDGTSAPIPVWCWRVGEALLVAQPNEPYSLFQIKVRQHHAPRCVIVLNVTIGYAGYLPPRSHYERHQYSVWQTPFAEGRLEKLTDVTCGA
jgi:hypothetical protein